MPFVRPFIFQAVNFSNSSIVIRKINLHQLVNNSIIMQHLPDTYIHHITHTFIFCFWIVCWALCMAVGKATPFIAWAATVSRVQQYCHHGSGRKCLYVLRAGLLWTGEWDMWLPRTVHRGYADGVPYWRWWTGPSLWTLHPKRSARDQ